MRRHHIVLAGAFAVVLAVSLYVIALGPPPPPGFIRDEASISYNAYTISQNLHDQNGGVLPLYIKSFGDYKSPLFVYVLAGVFRITGPGRAAALDTASTVVLASVLLLGLLAWRRTRRLSVAVATIVLAGLTPWLWELGRVAYETVIEPLAIVAILLALDWAYRSPRGWLVRALPVGLSLAALSYSYAAGRLLGPLWAAGLIVFAGRGRWRWLLGTWGVYALSMVPLVVYAFVHTGALSARYESTTFIHSGMSAWAIVTGFLSHYVHDVNLFHWAFSGDPKPYIHVHGAAQLYVTTLVLATIGVVALVRDRFQDPFWRFVVVALVLAPAAAALTDDRYYSLRLLPLPVLLGVLAIPGLEVVFRAARDDWPVRLAVAGLALFVAAQFWQWRHNYLFNNGGRAVAFEAHVPPLLQRAFDGDRVVYVGHDDIYAQTHALWYAVTHGLGRSRVWILPPGGAPPVRSIIFGRLEPCTCTRLAEADTFWIARATGS
jgi:hypothetical protein